MNDLQKFIDISKYINDINSDMRKNFGTGDFCYYFYGLVKMLKPKTIVELGTGYGCVSFLTALACEENNFGKIISVDDGRVSMDYSHHDLIHKKVTEFNIEKTFEYRKETINLSNPYQLNDIECVDILFNDIDCSPESFYSLLTWLLPRINNQCYFFIDKGAIWPTAMTIRSTVDLLNRGKVPNIMIQMSKDELELCNLIKKYEFSFEFIEKNVMHSQDSVALIKIKKL
jgi:hypothetical protein